MMMLMFVFMLVLMFMLMFMMMLVFMLTAMSAMVMFVCHNLFVLSFLAAKVRQTKCNPVANTHLLPQISRK